MSLKEPKEMALLDGLVGDLNLANERGAANFRREDVLPAKLRGVTVEELKELGFEVGELVDGDPLFRQAKLPESWTKDAGNHYWTYILDEKGTQRFSVFYKAAFYDRDAFMNKMD